MDTSGRWQEVSKPDSSICSILGASSDYLSKSSPLSSPPDSPKGEEKHPPRQRKEEGLLGALRRRLSLRSRSAEHAPCRRTSMDRPTPPVSPFRGRLLGGQLLSPSAAGSTRSSLSEASGVSASSAKTFIHENSTLVMETNENGIIKRYLIPNSMVQASRWRKLGTKLHIFNDHIFIARHLMGSTQCGVCRKRLYRRPGKQGYECRGCGLQCHKRCHIRVEEYCSNSSVSTMEVEYIHDPKNASPKSI